MPFWFELIILTKLLIRVIMELFIHYLLGIQIIYDRKFNWNFVYDLSSLCSNKVEKHVGMTFCKLMATPLEINLYIFKD